MTMEGIKGKLSGSIIGIAFLITCASYLISTEIPHPWTWWPLAQNSYVIASEGAGGIAVVHGWPFGFILSAPSITMSVCLVSL
jgi:hypothetical protein